MSMTEEKNTSKVNFNDLIHSKDWYTSKIKF